jgi:hypothetical protein
MLRSDSWSLLYHNLSQHRPAALSSIATSQLQDLHATVRAVTDADSIQQTASFQIEVAKLTQILHAQFRQENGKLATSLTET